MMDAALAARQKAARTVKRRMVEMLMGWEGSAEMRVREVEFIANMARTYAFDAFDDAARLQADPRDEDGVSE